MPQHIEPGQTFARDARGALRISRNFQAIFIGPSFIGITLLDDMKHWKRRTAFMLIAMSALAYATMSWIGAGWLLMPPRSQPWPWQIDCLSHAQTFGMRIERAVAANGTPYLLCVPDADAGPGSRGKILRGQLAARNVPLQPYGEVFGTVVLLHGWGGRKENMLAVAERFCASGLRCVIPDLPGHGDNPAHFSGFGMRVGEPSLPGDVLKSAAQRYLFPMRPAALWGISMGGAYALRASAAQPELWDALVVVSSFDALEPVVDGELDHAARGFAAFMNPGLAIAIRWRGGFLLSDVRPVDCARRLALPVLIVHGTADDLIPERQGRNLFLAVPHNRKEWLAVDGGLHGNVLGTPQHVFAEMAAWYARWLQPVQTNGGNRG